MHHSEQKCAFSVLHDTLWYMGQVHEGICELAPLLWPYKHAKKTEANQNWTDDGTHPPGTLCSLEEIGPVNKFIIIWLRQPKAGCTSKALTNPINSLAPTEIMS